MLTNISQLNDWRANKALVPEHVLVLLQAHLLVPPEGLHLRDELRVILRRRDGAALGAALQHHFLQQHTQSSSYFKPRLLCTSYHNLLSGAIFLQSKLNQGRDDSFLYFYGTKYTCTCICLSSKAIDNAWRFPFSCYSWSYNVKVTVRAAMSFSSLPRQSSAPEWNRQDQPTAAASVRSQTREKRHPWMEG